MTEQEKYQQLVDECNELASKFYQMLGYVGRKGFRFDKSSHPMELRMWDMAVIAYEELTGTDMHDVLSELNDYLNPYFGVPDDD